MAPLEAQRRPRTWDPLAAAPRTPARPAPAPALPAPAPPGRHPAPAPGGGVLTAGLGALPLWLPGADKGKPRAVAAKPDPRARRAAALLGRCDPR